ncbi:MAG: hypothetical protein R2753_12175 [Chitinophagales bacterium]
MKPYLFILCFALASNCFAQENPIELIEKKGDDKVVILAKNKSDKDLVVHLKVDLVNAQTNTDLPIKRVIEAGNEEVLGEISAVDIYEKWTYQTSLSYERYIPPINLMAQNDTVVLFTMTGCGRCDYTLDYLEHNNFNFVEYNTTRNFENNMLMWNTLKTVDPTVRDVRMPVIIVNGEISYNIKSLPAFVEALEPVSEEPIPATITRTP